MTWEEYLDRYAGVSRSYAYKLIRRLDEFGPTYFQLSGIVPVTPESYRRIAGSVRGEAIEIDGELVPIAGENAPPIRHFLEARRSQEAAEQAKSAGPSLAEVKHRLDACIRDLRAVAEPAASDGLRSELWALAACWIARLKEATLLP